MARDGSGTYSRAVADYAAATPISSTSVNTEMDDIAAEITNSIDKGGRTTTTAAIPFAAGIETNTVSEATAASGVTVDGVLLKDSVVTTDTISEKTSDAGVTVDGLLLKDGTAIFEGATADDFETTLTVVDPTADRTISLPDATDTLVGKDTTDTLTNKTLTAPTLTSPVINTGVSGTGLTGSDTKLVSGTAGTSGNLVQWNGDGDAVDSGVAASAVGVTTKEFFVAANLRGTSSTPYGASDGGWPVARAQSTNDDIFFTFKMPADFTSLTHAKIGIVPDATETVTYVINTYFAAAGEAKTTHSDTISNGSDAVTHDHLYELDVSDAFTGVAAGDWCALELNSDIDAIQVLGLTIKYA